MVIYMVELKRDGKWATVVAYHVTQGSDPHYAHVMAVRYARQHSFKQMARVVRLHDDERTVVSCWDEGVELPGEPCRDIAAAARGR
jgi:hypothetical protein